MACWMYSAQRSPYVLMMRVSLSNWNRIAKLSRAEAKIDWEYYGSLSLCLSSSLCEEAFYSYALYGCFSLVIFTFTIWIWQLKFIITRWLMRSFNCSVLVIVVYFFIDYQIVAQSAHIKNEALS